jgi:hypothetical protein
MPRKPTIRPVLFRLGKDGHFFATKSEAIEYWYQSTGKYKNSAPVDRIVFNTRAEMCDFINSLIREKQDG